VTVLPPGATEDAYTTVCQDEAALRPGVETIAALHRLPPPEIPGWWPAGWPGFVARQRAGCISEQRSLGLPEPWTAAMPGSWPGR
jgi:hypothetical protein